MAIQVWTPADGFTRKPVIVKPTVEKPKPKPPAQPSTRKRLTPSALKRQRACFLLLPFAPFCSPLLLYLCWLKQNQITARTIADDYLIKQAKNATPMVLLSYGMTLACTITKLWRYDLDLIIEGHKRRIHKLDMALYYKAADAAAVEKLLIFDSDSVEGRPSKKPSERYQVDDAVLLASRTDKTPLRFALRTGHTLTGVVRWFTAYDVGLMCEGVKVHLFKHAVSDCQPQC